MHNILANLSRLLSRLTGGAPGSTICKRAAMAWGWDCVLYRIVGRVLNQPTHCLEELDASEIVAVKRRRK